MYRGDQEAARALWSAHAGRLTALARAVTGSHADGLDAVQEAFMAVLNLSEPEVIAIQDDGAYLAGAVRGRSLNIARAGLRRDRHERRVEVGASALRLVETVDHDVELERALGELAMELREVVALRHIAGLTFEQIAGVLCVPRATAASRYYSGIERLREAVGPARPAGTSQEVARA